MLQPLLPIKLKKEDPAYQTVEELVKVLEHAIKNEDIRNIALTGPYGSGKSSIIHTLMDDYKQFHYLPISLATLQANNEGEEKGNNEQDTKKDEQSESLNRKIEYSILQQIIYREKAETVPNSRFKRIIHIEKDLLQYYSINGVLLILAFIVIFLPTIAEKLYSFLWLYQFRSLIVFFATFYFLWTVYNIFMYIIKSYSNSKLNKLNLKDAQIEIAEENSIFNKHLDEILYFFQVTSYNVVVVEDLDRFETEKIYLKLRELNQLVNESKIVGRHIVFLYAIKDDVFEDEARTKFFDYITTVIPVINPSNSKDKLKEALNDRGFQDGEISDGDLSEIAFFIQDMRILTNIANEYSQYRKKLYDTKKNNLNLTKLLAMIVYKNYYPKDFSQLHRREGLIYNCISSKPQFVAKALTTLDEKQKTLEEKEKLIEDNEHLKVSDIRDLFLLELCKIVKLLILSIKIDNNWYTLKQISQDDGLFEKLHNLDSIHYQYNGYYGSETRTLHVDFNVINKNINFEERLTAIKAKDKIIQKGIQKDKKELQEERLKIHRQKLSFLIKNYNLGETDLYKKIKLEPLMDVFIRQGYIDEDYYDYISYFYPGMVSTADRDLLLSIKRQIKQPYTYHIDKIDNFVKELKDYMFEHDAILNNELLDYLARKKNFTGHNMFTQMMSRLEKPDAPLGFLVQYYQLGKQQKEVFTDFVEWNKELSWHIIEKHSNDEEKQLLQEGWLKYCDEVTIAQTQWLNANYPFLSSRIDRIGLQKCKKLIKDCLFVKLDNNNVDLLVEVIEQCHFDINTENLCFVTNFLNKRNDVNPDNLNLTRITETNHPKFEEYIKISFVKAFTCFSTTCKDESVSNILYILNHKDLTPDQKVSYLTQQQNRIDNFSNIEEEYWDIVIESKVINPTWENIDFYYRKNEGLTAELSNYIEYYHSKLESECSDDVESKLNLFKDLLGTETLGIDEYSSICKAFDNQFDNYKGLEQLGQKRLQILLADNKIAFSDDNTEILQTTSIYPNYLIHYSREFLENINEPYNIDANCAFILLSSEKFSIQEKRQIVDIISLQIMLNSQELADKIIDVLLVSNNISVGQDFLNGLLQTARNEKNRVQLLVHMLSDYSYNNDEISSLLSLLGGKYKEIADREKHPVLENNEWNEDLLTKLKEIGFIFSTKPDKDGIRVHLKSN